MEKIIENLEDNLIFATQKLQETALPLHLANQFELLAQQVRMPCVLAVVGRVKAGKSTFINAFLEEDLAKVGTTETTATINYFSYGKSDSDNPVLCHWRNGNIQRVSRAFVDELQGYDPEILRRSAGIDYLEYRLENFHLQRATLVDTPGTGAIVDEHQDRITEFMHLNKELREQHSQQTEKLSSEADAVIYVIGEVAGSRDLDFLEAFHEVTCGDAKAFNSIGVLAKVDRDPELIRRRNQLAEKIASQLSTNLNTVVPVSAGLSRSLDHLLANDKAKLKSWITTLRQIPATLLDKLLADARFFLDHEFVDCPISTVERREMFSDMPWTVFTTIARTIADTTLSPEQIVERLNAISGFENLRDVLERHFLQRGSILRCFRIVKDAQRLLDDIKYQYLPDLRARDKVTSNKFERFISFVQKSGFDPSTAKELTEFLETMKEKSTNIDAIESIEHEIDKRISQSFHDLVAFNEDFETLLKIQDYTEVFSQSELEELGALFGLYGYEISKRLPITLPLVEAYVMERQQVWRRIQYDRNLLRSEIAERAVYRYGLILSDCDTPE